MREKPSYDINSHLIVGKQKTWKKIIEWILTIVAWLIMLTYIGYIIYGSIAIKRGWPLPEGRILNRMMLGEARKYYTIVLLALLVGFAIFIIWKNYNKHRFGSLKRRTFRPPVSKEELVEKFDLDSEMIDRLQNDRVITLEKNIIPEKMGMRR